MGLLLWTVGRHKRIAMILGPRSQCNSQDAAFQASSARGLRTIPTPVLPGEVQRGQILRKLPLSVRKFAKTAGARGSLRKPTEILQKIQLRKPAGPCGNPAEAYGSPTEALRKSYGRFSSTHVFFLE